MVSYQQADYRANIERVVMQAGRKFVIQIQQNHGPNYGRFLPEVGECAVSLFMFWGAVDRCV